MELPMDINDLRVFFTLASLACFGGIARGAYSRSSRARFEEDAMLPFNDEAVPSQADREQT